MKPAQIRSMVSLLGDRSIRVRNRVATSLECELSDHAEILEEILEEQEDPLIREKLTFILAMNDCPGPAQQWAFMRENLFYNLRDGMASLALLDEEHPTTRIDVLQMLDDISDEWFKTLPENATQDEIVLSLLDFLFQQKGFSGNSEDYYSLENCFLHRILETGRGLPVTLSILAVILAEEAGLPVYGIGLPLHFIIGYFQGSKGIRFFDCFDGGREVTQDECVQYLHSRGIFLHPQLLSPCDNEAILNRVLINIKHIAQRKGLREQLTVIESLTGSGELRMI